MLSHREAGGGARLIRVSRVDRLGSLTVSRRHGAIQKIESLGSTSMKKVAVTCLALSLFAALAACRSGDSGPSRAEKQAQADKEMYEKIPADSPLAKIKKGMPESEVESILGRPTSQDNHTTGKQFIPFNFAAKDTMRLVYYYKGIGRVEFSFGSWGQRNGAVNIVSDKNDPGYRR
jgi:hypothetical protein